MKKTMLAMALVISLVTFSPALWAMMGGMQGHGGGQGAGSTGNHGMGSGFMNDGTGNWTHHHDAYPSGTMQGQGGTMGWGRSPQMQRDPNAPRYPATGNQGNRMNQ